MRSALGPESLIEEAFNIGLSVSEASDVGVRLLVSCAIVAVISLAVYWLHLGWQSRSFVEPGSPVRQHRG